MKRVYKGAAFTLVLAAVGLTVWSAAAKKQAVSQPEANVVHAPAAAPGESADLAGQSPGGPEGADSPVAAGAAGAAAGVAVAARVVEEPSVPVPEDLRVTVKKTAAGHVVNVRRPKHVVALKVGSERRVGMTSVDWATKPGEATRLVWETTHEKTLETTRGELAWPGGDGEVSVQNATLRPTTTSESSASHVCRAHDDGAGGFVVLCRVDASAAAAAVDGDDPKRGVWSQAGGTTLVRFDIPMSGDGVDTRVLGYEKAGKGVLVRVEASRAPGESAPVLAILADSRAQPQVVRRIGCFCTFEGVGSL